VFSQTVFGRVYVLIHGLGLRQAMWDVQVARLQTRFRAITYDLLGHGESAKPRGRVELEDLADQLVQLLDDTGTEACALVGFSLGGMIARSVAIAHPTCTLGLVILNSAHDRSESERGAVRSRVSQAWREGPTATVEAALERWFTPGFAQREPGVISEVREWVVANDPAVYSELYRVLAEGDRKLARAIGAIACPVLVITGAADHGNSADMARRMAERMADARVEIVPE
jgi:pimeloyl-ACP methyl ester carboxylesterase